MRPGVRYLQDADGNSIAYTVHGQGPNLVLPAWWISHVERDWDHPSYRAFLEALGSHFRVVRYDRAGVGLSDREVGSQTMGSEVRLLADVVETTIGNAKTSLFAFSCGCPVALAYAAGHSNRVEKICIYGGYLDGADIAAPDIRAAMVGLVRAHWGAGSRALADVFLPDQSREEIDAASRQQRDSATAETAAALLELTYEMDATAVASSVTNDLLIIHRAGDRAIPPDAGRKLASVFSGVPIVVLDGRAHPPWVGDSDSILTLAVEFLTGQSYRSSRSTENSDVSFLDVDTRTLVLSDGQVSLTALEFGAIHYFAENPGRVVTRAELLEHVWKTPFAGSNKVDVLIRALRKKLGAHSTRLETVPGHGYLFRGDFL